MPADPRSRTWPQVLWRGRPPITLSLPITSAHRAVGQCRRGQPGDRGGVWADAHNAPSRAPDRAAITDLPREDHAVAQSDPIAALNDECDALDAVLGGLSRQDWNLQTPAPGWTISHQVAHLAATFQ